MTAMMGAGLMLVLTLACIGVGVLAAWLDRHGL